jgi:hypothetical protein
MSEQQPLIAGALAIAQHRLHAQLCELTAKNGRRPLVVGIDCCACADDPCAILVFLYLSNDDADNGGVPLYAPLRTAKPLTDSEREELAMALVPRSVTVH